MCEKEICSEFRLDRYIMSPLCGENLPQCHYFDESWVLGISVVTAQPFADHDRMFLMRHIVGMLASSSVASWLAVCVRCYSSVAYVWTRCKFSRWHCAAVCHHTRLSGVMLIQALSRQQFTHVLPSLRHLQVTGCLQCVYSRSIQTRQRSLRSHSWISA